MDKITCPVCLKRYHSDAGQLPDHADRTGDECPGANLPLWAAEVEALARKDS